VDFERSLLALTGTSENLLITNFKGESLAEFKNAAEGRILAVKFSPNGKFIAVGSRDNTVRVFALIR